MNMLPILLKREFWEHRKTFFYLPLIILVLSAFFLIAVVGSVQIAGGDIIVSGSVQMNEEGTKRSQHFILEVHARVGCHDSHREANDRSRCGACHLLHGNDAAAAHPVSNDGGGCPGILG